MWWAVDPHRLELERLAIDALDAAWFQAPEWSFGDQLRLELTFDLVLARGTFPLRLTYHGTFPASPPSVSPADGETRLSTHQYGPGGDLCLDIRNDNWSPDITGADMIESARRLLASETPDDDGAPVTAPSAHDVPMVIRLRHEVKRFYVDPIARIALMGEDIDGAAIEIGLDYRSGDGVVAHLFVIGDSDARLQPQTPRALKKSSFLLEGRFATVDLKSLAIGKIKTLGELNAVVGKPITFEEEGSYALLLRGADNLLTLIIAHGDRDDLWTYETVYAPFEAGRSGEDTSPLSTKRVGIVGLGSVGSKVAISLARTGVRSFDLVDADIFHTGNLERHEADWRDVGRHKADIIEHRLRLIDKHMKVRARRSAIGAQISSQEAGNINQALAACDLLIDATGNPDVFNHLAGLALRHNQDLVWGSVFAGGVGGEIARARLGKDPSPYDVRGALNAYYQSAEAPPPVAAGRGYDGSVGEEAPMTATDADVERLAGEVSALAIDTLLGTEPSLYDAHSYLIGFRRAWVFEGPFDTHPVLADAAVRQSFSPPDGAEVDSEFIRTLLEKAVDEAQD
ncbi:ThiF family adenylyltransferase [Parvularcula oceani]|uniref:ThiF family adenylyltransferase n=1 Tax=Parvularcula oceani TaxID=1247963 RepID=UPI0004E20C36|nr:ThiF family adenylyltransferase [Parvularcula oceani]